MSRLSAKIEGGILEKHYQRGALRLLEVPVHNDGKQQEFFAFLSTLGGGMVDGDNYEQAFDVIDSKANICSQSNQKIYKGTSSLKTKINVAGESTLVYHNDANIFYQNSHFTSLTHVNLSKDSKLFFLDGGFTGYAHDDFETKMLTRISIDYKLLYNDVFHYSNKSNVVLYSNLDYFYTILIKGELEVKNIKTPELIANSSKLKDLLIIRVLSSDNDIAMTYINEIRQEFVSQNDMTYVKINQF